MAKEEGKTKKKKPAKTARVVKSKTKTKTKTKRTAAKRKPGRSFWTWTALALPALCGAGLYAAAHYIQGFAEWYACRIYPIWVGIFGRIFSLLPFSLSEIGLYLLASGTALWLLIGAWRVLMRRVGIKAVLLAGARRLLLVSGCLLLVFMLGGGINYSRRPFSSVAGFVMEKSSAEELAALCRRLVSDINERRNMVERDENGVCLPPAGIRGLSVAAMRAVGERYEALSGYYPMPKAALWSDFLSYQHLSGVFSPFTVEAHYNGAMTGYNIGLTICHELSHLKGFMREDEANFIAYLACEGSEDVYMQYSGAMIAFIYASNALYGESPELWQEIRASLCGEAETDLRYNNAFWKRYEGKVSEVSNTVNDTYLKINKQTDGVKSYGRMVDLLLAYERARGEN